jgi:methyl-accepting chemotaxis protein
MNKNRGLKLSSKLNLFIIPSIIIMIVIVAVVMYYQTFNQSFIMQKQNITGNSTQFGEFFESMFRDISDLVYVNSMRRDIIDELKNGDKTILLDFSKNLGNRNEFYESVMIANKDGILVSHTEEKFIGNDIKEYDFWEGVRKVGKNEVYMDKNAFKSKVTEHVVFNIASAIRDDNEDFLGIFAISVDMSLISNELLLNKTFIDSGYGFLVDAEGDVIAHPNSDILLTNHAQTMNPAIKSDTKTGFYSYPWEGKTKYMSYYKLEDLNWILSISIYQDDLIKVATSILPILIIIGAGFILVMTVIFIFVIRNIIINRLKPTVELVKEISEGNLTLDKINLKGNDEINNLTDYANKMLEFLNRMVKQIDIAVQNIDEGSNQIAESSQNLSDGSFKQSAAIEEISSSAQEISSQVQQSVEHIEETNNQTEVSRENAVSCNKQMKQLVEFMNNIYKSAENIKRIIDTIRKSTGDIKNIVKVIDDIAFQTNLLALNADIEAARVGKYGKGFAVVAGSVRTLAQKSSESVKETTDRIESIIKNIEKASQVDEVIENIEKGNTLVNNTSEQLNEITDGAIKISSLSQEILEASQEQASGIEEISTSISSVEEITQNNSATAEENAATTEELASQTKLLIDLVSYFKVTQDEKDLVKYDDIKDDSDLN